MKYRLVNMKGGKAQIVQVYKIKNGKQRSKTLHLVKKGGHWEDRFGNSYNILQETNRAGAPIVNMVSRIS